MSKIHGLVSKRTELSSQRKAVLDKAIEENRGLSAEEKESVRKFGEEIDSLEETIQEYNKHTAQEVELSRPAPGTPRIEVVREENHDEEGNYRGYAEFAKAGFGEFLRDVVQFARNNHRTDKLDKLQKWAAQGGAVGVGSDGGVLVQPDHVNEVFMLTVGKSQIASKCKIIDTDTGTVTLNLVDETSRATGSRRGGVQAYRRAEAGSVTATKPKFHREEIRADAMDALYYATDELLDDVSALQSLVAPMFADELYWKLEDEILGGNGAGGQCLGVLNSPVTIEVAKESGQANNTIVYANVVAMLDSLLPSSEARAEFVHHRLARAQFRNMVHTPGSNTDFMPYVPRGGGVLGEKFDTLAGYPAQAIEQARAVGNAGDLILADWSYYALVRRKGIQASQSAHIAFLTGETAFKWSQRVGGAPLLKAPITDAYGNGTTSPFVVLAARTA